MIIADLPCLEHLCQKEISGGGKYTYYNAVASAYAGSYDDYDVSAIIGKYKGDWNVSAYAGSYADGYDASAYESTSIYVGQGYTKYFSVASAQSSSY